MRQYLVGVMRQQAQELILDRRQMQLLAIHRGDAGIKIDMQLTGIERASEATPPVCAYERRLSVVRMRASSSSTENGLVR